MKRIYIPILLTLALTACQESNITPEASVLSNEMSFDVIAPGAQTKVLNNAFEASDVIGLYVTDYVDDNTPMPLQISGNRANNTQVTYDEGAWIPDLAIFWGEAKSDVFAYYPYSESISDVNAFYFKLAPDQTAEGYEMSDFLWAKATGVRQTDGAVNLEMKHVMSKLTVRIVAGDEYIGSLPEDASVQLHSTVTNANINLETGSVVKDPYSGAQSIMMKNLGIKSFEGQKAVVYEAIVVPQMLESSVPLLEINSKSVSYLIEDPFNFRPGVAYTYTVTLNTSTTAIKVEIGCELEDWNSAGGGESGEGGESGDGGSDEGEDDGVEYTDLSAEGTANCYLIQEAGDYKFKTVIGNTDATVGNVNSVEVLWESFGTDEMPNVGDLIASVSYKNGYIRFSTPENFRDGNAVIAAKNSKGNILWSWHIWCAEEGWQDQVYYNNAGTMMDRNLGATSATPGDVGALGLLYQWGRKDPFLGRSSIKSTGTWNKISSIGSQAEAESNPMTLYNSLTMPDGSWSSSKTVYDPCPSGYNVPEGGDSGVWSKALGSSSTFTDKSLYNSTNKSMNFSGKFGPSASIWYPVMGHYSSGVYGDDGYRGYYWSSTPRNKDYAYFLKLSQSGEIVPSSGDNTKSAANSVRCIKE